MKQKRYIYFSAVVMILIFCGAIVFPGVGQGFFGYGYDCGGKYGYGYSCGGSKVKQYKHYKEKYKNHSAKIMYYKMKYLKKGSSEEMGRFEELRAVFKKYKHLSSDERRANLTPKEYAEFQAYQNYYGYKKYKDLKKEIGK